MPRTGIPVMYSPPRWLALLLTCLRLPIWLLFSLQTSTYIQIHAWNQARGVTHHCLTCLLFSSLSITKEERGNRGHWWDLYFINPVIHASLPLPLWLLKQWNSMNQTSLPLGESLTVYSRLSPLLPRTPNTKELQARSRLFVANSPWPFPTKHGFQRQSSAGRPSRTTECVQRNKAPCMFVWFFSTGCRIFAFVKKSILQTQKSRACFSVL